MLTRSLFLAAGWFAVAAVLAIFVNPISWMALARPLSDPSTWLLIIDVVRVPGLCAAAVAFCLGAGILDASRVRSVWWAMLHGLRVAVLALLLYSVLLSLH